MGLFEPSTQNLTTQTKVPSDVQQFRTDTLNQAHQTTTRPYETYDQPRVAPFTDAQEQAMVQGVQQAGQQDWMTAAGGTQQNPGFMQQLSGFAQGERNLPQQDLSGYTNPYTQQVINTTMDELRRQNELAQAEIERKFANAGAYGGSRQAVSQQEAIRNFLDKASQTAAQLNERNFMNAQQQAQRDIGRQFSAAQQLPAAAQRFQDMAYTDTARMYDIGARQQALAQQGLDTRYEDFLRQWNYPLEMLDTRVATASGVPRGSTQTGQQLTADPWSQAIGAGVAGLGTYKSLFPEGF